LIARDVNPIGCTASGLTGRRNEEQKEEVRQLAHLIGLQRLASMI